MNKSTGAQGGSTSQKQIKIYVGCSLTHAPEAFKQAVEALKQNLRQQYEVFNFLGLEAGTAQDVYRWDINNCVANADLFVAICDYTSLGLGYEIGTAVEKYHKPVLAVAHRDAHISRMILGVDDPGYAFKRYNDFSEVPHLVAEFITTYS